MQLPNLNQQQLTVLIDTCYAAVEASRLGKMIVRKDANGDQVINGMGFQVLLTLIGRLVPNVQAPATVTARQELPREPWQDRDADEGGAD